MVIRKRLAKALGTLAVGCLKRPSKALCVERSATIGDSLSTTACDVDSTKAVSRKRPASALNVRIRSLCACGKTVQHR